MKTTKVVLAVFMVCFLFGVGIVSVSPSRAEAGSGGYGCHSICPIVECRDLCENEIDYEHWRCKIDGRLAIDLFNCELMPHDCGCVFIGCGGACNIE